MISFTEKEDDAILDVLKKFAQIDTGIVHLDAQVKIINEIMRNQTKMLEIALDVMIAIANDKDAEMRVRRRLLFALEQIKGIGMPS